MHLGFSLHLTGIDPETIQVERIEGLQQAVDTAYGDPAQSTGGGLDGIFLKCADTLVGDDDGLCAAAECGPGYGSDIPHIRYPVEDQKQRHGTVCNDLVDCILQVDIGEGPGDRDHSLVIGAGEAVELFYGHEVDRHLPLMCGGAQFGNDITFCRLEQKDPLDRLTLPQSLQDGLPADDQMLRRTRLLPICIWTLRHASRRPICIRALGPATGGGISPIA